MEKQKVYTAILSDHFIPFEALQTNNFFMGFCPNSRLSRPAGNVCNFRKALLVKNGPLPAKLKFRENNDK